MINPFKWFGKTKKEIENLVSENDMLRSQISSLAQIVRDIQTEIQDDIFMKDINSALDEFMADMFWVKGLDNKYLLANKRIREDLLFDDNPIGKTDVEMATAQINRVGAENHTFGQVCANSDLIVIDREKPMKFNEDGIVNGKYMMLQVHKNVLRNEAGMIIGTVGIGRDITYETEALNDIMATTKDKNTRNKIKALLEHYAYNDRS